MEFWYRIAHCETQKNDYDLRLTSSKICRGDELVELPADACKREPSGEPKSLIVRFFESWCFDSDSVNAPVTLRKSMLFSEFAVLLVTSTADAIAFARSMVLDELPANYRYRVFPNQSWDGPLEPDDVVYPNDSLDDMHGYIEMGRNACIRYLYRDGRVPQWIDISVGAVAYDFTYIYLRCCGRFTADDERLYYKRFDRGPFGIKSPTIPPHIELGDRETKFWIGGAAQPPRSG
jgi:hypothetical protein